MSFQARGDLASLLCCEHSVKHAAPRFGLLGVPFLLFRKPCWSEQKQMQETTQHIQRIGPRGTTPARCPRMTHSEAELHTHTNPARCQGRRGHPCASVVPPVTSAARTQATCVPSTAKGRVGFLSVVLELGPGVHALRTYLSLFRGACKLLAPGARKSSQPDRPFIPKFCACSGAREFRNPQTPYHIFLLAQKHQSNQK